jgi:electron transfer flavoprotein beta subunit
MSPYDLLAVELALQLKDTQSSEVAVLTIDNNTSSSILKHALAMGADEGIVLSDETFEGSDSFSTAYILSQAIQKIGNYDLILCGRQAADWDEGLVGTILAEYLGLPLVTRAYDLEKKEGQWRVKRSTLDGYQLFSVVSPAVVTVCSAVGQPRLPSGWGIIAATQKDLIVWKAQDIGADPSRTGSRAARRTLAKLYVPKQDRSCEIIEDKTVAQASGKLAEKLVKEGIVPSAT